MITGRLDLSIGSVVAFVGTVVAVMVVDWGLPAGVAIPLGLLLRAGNRSSWAAERGAGEGMIKAAVMLGAGFLDVMSRQRPTGEPE